MIDKTRDLIFDSLAKLANSPKGQAHVYEVCLVP